MKILVPAKRVPDTDQRVQIRADGRGIDANALPFVINPFDAIAIEEAVRIRESSDGPVQVVVVGIGVEQYEEQLRTALAMGADRGLLVVCDQPLDPWNVARLLQAVVLAEQPELVLMGKQAVDDDANQTGQFLAALLDWPQATFASRLKLIDGGIRVWRETDRGIEVVSMDLPAVVTTDLRLNEPRYASLPSLLKARKKPIQRVRLAELGVELEPRVQLLELKNNAQQRSVVQLDGVDELIERLRNEARVI